VPLQFGHFRDQKPTARSKELGLLGVERGSPGPKGPAPKGLKNLAQGLAQGKPHERQHKAASLWKKLGRRLES
jgi:hypothetical protein